MSKQQTEQFKYQKIRESKENTSQTCFLTYMAIKNDMVKKIKSHISNKLTTIMEEIIILSTYNYGLFH